MPTISCSAVRSAVKSNDLTSLPHVAVAAVAVAKPSSTICICILAPRQQVELQRGGGGASGCCAAGCGSISSGGALCWLRMQSHKRRPRRSRKLESQFESGRPNESGHRQLLLLLLHSLRFVYNLILCAPLTATPTAPHCLSTTNEIARLALQFHLPALPLLLLLFLCGLPRRVSNYKKKSSDLCCAWLADTLYAPHSAVQSCSAAAASLRWKCCSCTCGRQLDTDAHLDTP